MLFLRIAAGLELPKAGILEVHPVFELGETGLETGLFGSEIFVGQVLTLFNGSVILSSDEMEGLRVVEVFLIGDEVIG